MYYLRFFRAIIELLGIVMLVLLSMYSIVLLRTGTTNLQQVNLTPLVKDTTLAWIWIISLIGYTTYMIIRMVTDIKRGIRKIRNRKLTFKLSAILKWLLEN